VIAVDRVVARLNIEHYHKLLASETDETKRLKLVRLLANEEAKLAALGYNHRQGQANKVGSEASIPANESDAPRCGC
jgi:hypothetical protein